MAHEFIYSLKAPCHNLVLVYRLMPLRGWPVIYKWIHSVKRQICGCWKKKKNNKIKVTAATRTTITKHFHWKFHIFKKLENSSIFQKLLMNPYDNVSVTLISDCIYWAAVLNFPFPFLLDFFHSVRGRKEDEDFISVLPSLRKEDIFPNWAL